MRSSYDLQKKGPPAGPALLRRRFARRQHASRLAPLLVLSSRERVSRFGCTEQANGLNGRDGRGFRLAEQGCARFVPRALPRQRGASLPPWQNSLQSRVRCSTGSVLTAFLLLAAPQERGRGGCARHSARGHEEGA